jgi:MoaA/NifB/PqqE/SkfB family radical SAM enzyme
MIDKEKYICTVPFSYTEVFDDRQYLCCPSWLDVDIWDGNGIKSSFNSKKANDVRNSILDGSYKYCNHIQCPYLSGMKNEKLSKKFIEKTKESIDFLKNSNTPNTINFCFDRSCNFQCPSCRNELINYLGNDRKSVDLKLKEIENEISTEIKRLYLSGSADPFYSKSFRQFLINLDSKKFKNLKSIHLHTNASLWNEDMWEKMKSIHPFVNSCEISIDAATKETYETKTRIGGNWETLLDNLKFITKIPTIKFYSFSFVVQDTNYTEMYDFYKMIEMYMKCRIDDTIWEVKTNVITNWGTYTDKEFLTKDVSNPEHREHKKFLKILENMKNFSNFTNNFNHLYEIKKRLI